MSQEKKSFFNFWNNKELTAEKQNEMLTETCRKVFSTEDGKIVLNMLLTDLFFLRQAHTKRENFLNDYAKFFIRNRLGVRETKDLTDFIAETAASGGGS